MLCVHRALNIVTICYVVQMLFSFQELCQLAQNISNSHVININDKIKPLDVQNLKTLPIYTNIQQSTK